MSESIIHHNRPQMREEATALGQAAEQVETSIGVMNKIKALIEDGGLRGDAGDSFTEAISDSLIPAMQRLQDNLIQAQGYIYKELADLVGAESETQQMLK